MSAIQNTLKQPLIHFIIVGFLIFLFYGFIGNEESEVDAAVILVDRTELINFMQYRADSFNQELYADQFDRMDSEQKQSLIDEYFREEALYREALLMGIDRGDYNIKQRMVEKVVFLLQSNVTELAQPTSKELEKYYNDNQRFYTRPVAYTFAHVFVDDPQHSLEGQERIEDLLKELQESEVDFFKASEYGDSFPYLQNYVRRSRDFIRNNFDEGFADWLDLIDPEEGLWQGIVESPFGYHAVMLSNRFEETLPPLEELRERVLEDFLIESQYLARREAEQKLIEKYKLELGEI